MEFDCSGCGLCCEHVAEHPDVPHANGICLKFDRTTRRCTDYENRPDICNVCKTYDCFKDQYTEEEYLALNYKACEYLKSRYVSIIGGPVP